MTTDPVTIARRPRGKGLRGQAARARKQQAGALHLEHRTGSAHRRTTDADER